MAVCVMHRIIQQHAHVLQIQKTWKNFQQVYVNAFNKLIKEMIAFLKNVWVKIFQIKAAFATVNFNQGIVYAHQMQIL